MREVIFIRLEADRSSNEQVEEMRTEPVNVAKFWDDLLLGVKGQSRSVIASSPRKVFKY